jgi:hypothetical protein
MNRLPYRPDNYTGPIAQNAQIGVRFSDDVFLLKSFLDQRGVKYEKDELEDSAFGKGVRIKKGKR